MGLFEVFAITAIVFVLAMIGMGVGVIFSNRKLSGSCGGVGSDGESIGDCLCSEEGEAIRQELADNEIAQLASLGSPSRTVQEEAPSQTTAPTTGRAEWVDVSAKPHDEECSPEDRDQCGC